MALDTKERRLNALNLARPFAPTTLPETGTDHTDARYHLAGLMAPAPPIPNRSVFRCLYRASNGDLYGVVGKSVYYIAPTWTFTRIGTIDFRPTPVSIADNGLVAVLVDGSAKGYAINLSSRAFAQFFDAAFYGADRADYVDTFFTFNRPGTRQWYISPSQWVPGIAFDPLDIVAKTGYPDDVQTQIVMAREVWILGTLKGEVWADTGAADFAFQALPGVFIEHGCGAKYSVAAVDLAVFWLSQDLQGHRMVMRGTPAHTVERVSTHAIEDEWRRYGRVDDAIGFTYQQGGHAFYVLTFPSADATWVFDLATEEWHQRAWLDENGVLRRHRANCCAFAYGQNVVGDWQDGRLYALDLDAYEDDGDPIVRIRGFPHLVNDGKRVFYRNLIADIEVGTTPGTVTDDPPLISLRWSDTRGASWGNAITASKGSAGQYLTSVQFQRLGMARDRVFELAWIGRGALQGAFIDLKSAGT